ncbi:hypothetical protein TrVE_jg8267 [Triparma verrucosa]|uniref:Uncharacterized protein n=1 Tax=Triparma verrucosa TaxID=1606542 RepID=A0A9W6Z3M2_9STRA|nr:hypothetical protein TrVE_jg8267 [Triparma verrucosa]
MHRLLNSCLKSGATPIRTPIRVALNIASPSLRSLPKQPLSSYLTSTSSSYTNSLTNSFSQDFASILHIRNFTTTSKGTSKGSDSDDAASPPPPTASPDSSSADSPADWRDLSLSNYEVTQSKHWDGGQKRVRRKKKSSESDKVLRPDVTGIQPSVLPPSEMQALLEEAYANIPERGGRQRKNHFRRQAVKYHIVRKNYKIAARQRAVANSRKMEKRSRIAKECREMRALCHEIYPEYNKGKIGNPTSDKKEYGWMRGRVKDQQIMRRRAEEEGVDPLERYERVQEEKRERREMGKNSA